VLLLAVSLLSAITAGSAGAAANHLEENWDGYTSGSTPYGPNNGLNWELKSGEWMALTGGPALSDAQSYVMNPGDTSEIRYPVDLAAFEHIAVQGWLHDTGFASTSWLGLTNHETVNNSLIRIGTNNTSTYQVQYGEFFAGTGIQTVDTGLPIEAGWHYARLDIVNANYLNFWECTWRIYSADQSVQNTGKFSWFFDRASATRVVLGSDQMTPFEVAWDDIKVGSGEFVGPPVPEPGGMLVLCSGLIGLVGLACRRRG
jgi:hypothetical protein